MLHLLPQEIINLIYEFDGTKRENFNKVLEELNENINRYNIPFHNGYFCAFKFNKYMRWRENQIKINEIVLDIYANKIEKYYHVLNWRIGFGKYKGQIYGAIPEYYTEWLLNQDILKGDLKEYYTLKEKIKDIERTISYYKRDGFD